MNKLAIYPGSFDPVTLGHQDLINRSLHFVERLIVGVAVNTVKDPLFTHEERMQLLQEVTAGQDRVEVKAFQGLLVDFAREVGASMVVRGLRAVSDFDYEFQMALMNRQLMGDLETVFLVPALHLTYLSSSVVREVASFGGDVSEFVHPLVNKALHKKFGR
jgi:pantetheine-phosphate adenylyltransferase